MAFRLLGGELISGEHRWVSKSEIDQHPGDCRRCHQMCQLVLSVRLKPTPLSVVSEKQMLLLNWLVKLMKRFWGAL